MPCDRKRQTYVYETFIRQPFLHFSEFGYIELTEATDYCQLSVYNFTSAYVCPDLAHYTSGFGDEIRRQLSFRLALAIRDLELGSADCVHTQACMSS